MAKKNKKIIRLILLIIIIIASVTATYFGSKWIFSLRDPAKLKAFQTQIHSLGPIGWLVLLAIQYIQIVVAFIPGGPIQVIAGALYGPLGGLAICLIGTIAASGTVFFLVSRYGKKITKYFVGEKDMKKYGFLENENKLGRLTLLLFYVPGTPKDALTYMFAMTPIPMAKFMLYSTIMPTEQPRKFQPSHSFENNFPQKERNQTAVAKSS